MSKLWDEVLAGNLHEAKLLVGSGVNVNEKDVQGRSVLHYAAGGGFLHIVEHLIDNNANVNLKDNLNVTALHLAVKIGSLDIIKCLVEHGANVNLKSIWNESAIQYAVRFGSLNIVKYLVENGAEVSSKDTDVGETVLHWACTLGDDSIVVYLLQHGAEKDINKNDGLGFSPLCVACYRGHTAVVRKLLKFNVDIKGNKELICGNDEICNILEGYLNQSIKHKEKIQKLIATDNEKLTKVASPLKYFVSEPTFAIGSGSMGTFVYVGILEDGSEVAVKRMLIQACGDIAENERKILSLINSKKSPYIVNYRNFFTDNLFVYLIVDLCEDTLKEYVRCASIELIRKNGRRMIKETLTGLQFLHDQGILHRDLKPSNILVDIDSHMRLADFGLSRVLEEDETTILTDAKGTRDWMSIEVIKAISEQSQGHFKRKSDLQVVGMIAFYILTKGEHPFGVSHQRMTNILEGNPVNMESLDDPIARHFVSWLLSHNLNDRPYAHEALGHSFMDNIPEATSRTKILRG